MSSRNPKTIPWDPMCFYHPSVRPCKIDDRSRNSQLWVEKSFNFIDLSTYRWNWGGINKEPMDGRVSARNNIDRWVNMLQNWMTPQEVLHSDFSFTCKPYILSECCKHMKNNWAQEGHSKTLNALLRPFVHACVRPRQIDSRWKWLAAVEYRNHTESERCRASGRISWEMKIQQSWVNRSSILLIFVCLYVRANLMTAGEISRLRVGFYICIQKSLILRDTLRVFEPPCVHPSIHPRKIDGRWGDLETVDRFLNIIL